MEESTKRVSDVIIDTFKLIGIAIGGIWVYFRFRTEDGSQSQG